MLTFMTHIFLLDKVHSLKDGILDFKTLIQKFHLGCYSEKFLLPLIVTFNPKKKFIHNIAPYFLIKEMEALFRLLMDSQH